MVDNKLKSKKSRCEEVDFSIYFALESHSEPLCAAQENIILLTAEQPQSAAERERKDPNPKRSV